MAEGKDYLGEKLRLVERAREDAYFRKLDQELVARLRQQDTAATTAAATKGALFSPVLVPIDFSEYSTEALRHAIAIATRFQAPLIVLHVISRDIETQAAQQQLGQRAALPSTADSPFTDVSTQELEGIVLGLRDRAYEALQNFLPPAIAQCEVELRVIAGNPFERILETAIQQQAGLIVMGTHGRSGLAHVIMGSVAERIVRLAPCPVLTVKSSSNEETGWLQRFYQTFMPS